MSTPNLHAPPGHVYVCLACGKRSRDAYGDKAINAGWDESCFMNRALVREDECVLENERVVRITPHPRTDLNTEPITR